MRGRSINARNRHRARKVWNTFGLLGLFSFAASSAVIALVVGGHLRGEATWGSYLAGVIAVAGLLVLASLGLRARRERGQVLEEVEEAMGRFDRSKELGPLREARFAGERGRIGGLVASAYSEAIDGDTGVARASAARARDLLDEGSRRRRDGRRGPLMAHTKPLGTFCELYLDTDQAMRKGDVIRTSAREPAHYRVVGARRVGCRSKHYPYRWNLERVRVGPDDVDADDHVRTLRWQKRNRRRRSS